MKNGAIKLCLTSFSLVVAASCTRNGNEYSNFKASKEEANQYEHVVFCYNDAICSGCLDYDKYSNEEWIYNNDGWEMEIQSDSDNHVHYNARYDKEYFKANYKEKKK